MLRADASKFGPMAVGGALVESFVVSEIRKQIALLDEVVLLAHYRNAAGREVDMDRGAVGRVRCRDRGEVLSGRVCGRCKGVAVP